jgi:ethanolamine phosphate transferase 2 subunit G
LSHLVHHSKSPSIQTDNKKGGQLFTRFQLATIITLLLHRILQRWNQTGQKFSGAPDIVTSQLIVQPMLLWTLVGITYVAVTVRTAHSLSNALSIPYVLGTLCAILLTVPALVFKICFTAADSPELFYFLQGSEVEWLQTIPLIPLARTIFASLGLALLLIISRSLSTRPNRTPILPAIHALLSILLLTQSRTPNIPLFLLFQTQYLALSALHLSPTQITVTTVLLGHASFFALGNSNAISSVDLSNAYNGVTGYNVLAVGVLVFVGNWAGPIWWGVGSVVLMGVGKSKKEGGEKKMDEVEGRSGTQEERAGYAGEDAYGTYFALSSLFASGSLLAVQIACTALRTHLFIWTVFSPKYLYSMAWVLGYHLLICLGLNGALWSLR